MRRYQPPLAGAGAGAGAGAAGAGAGVVVGAEGVSTLGASTFGVSSLTLTSVEPPPPPPILMTPVKNSSTRIATMASTTAMAVPPLPLFTTVGPSAMTSSPFADFDAGQRSQRMIVPALGPRSMAPLGLKSHPATQRPEMPDLLKQPTRQIIGPQTVEHSPFIGG
ncbi:hypothetical protein EJ074_06145 [Mesorhizobium sp. M3A.F.Ca.ET.080.04.2.1]|nr:hypothetical protein EJ074_06145 [Mesorhizobium sp. M3A.F.Ca.ET.080.04.2.1]RWB83658.1 MAG: hypothetical protein EOQ52_25970 [Mesorhizobium sp.]RWE22739.1 MAG: hypothetical protein EOS41_23835 [Mesorhizobium sp.]TGT60972.1 hypothetical protein EN813_018530 [Mesorhizobium sp. M00.F.Ca.ET.170.01.1.1]